MQKNWKSIAVALLGALATAAIGLLNRKSESLDAPVDNANHPAQSNNVTSKPAPTGMRATAIEFLSDLIAETYRKIRLDQRSK